MKKSLKDHQNTIWLIFGCFAMICTIIPNLILGLDAIFTYHDQLDGEMLAYILQAKNLFGGNELPEFMGGMAKTALLPPAPLLVLLFMGGHYFEALLTIQLMGRICGFLGMYLLAREVSEREFPAAVSGMLYGLLPFLPVYGLSQFGVPLLFWCILQLKKEKNIVFSYGYVVLYGVTSSLVLVGFGVLGMGVLWMLWSLWQNRRGTENKHGITLFFGAWIVLLCIYIAENIHLLKEVLGIGASTVSHKVEYRLVSTPIVHTFVEYLFHGGQHSEGYQKLLVPVMLVAAVAGVCMKQYRSKSMVGLLHCIGWNGFLAFAAALWSAEPMVAIRSGMGSLGAFQMDRLLWIAPCFWYLGLACTIGWLLELWREAQGLKMILASGAVIVLAGITAFTVLQILQNGDIKSNVQKLRNPDYGLLSYRDYYGIGVLNQVESYLQSKTGMRQEEYRVASLGIDPAAALYHGFYCVDGYSNNYPLEYKHKFREVIAPELEKSEYLDAYYDDWGNRCYLFSSECPGYYTLEKNGFYFQDYEMNAGALRALGCDYLLSAAYIQNAEEQALELMCETPFETEESYYRIFVYRVCE